MATRIIMEFNFVATKRTERLAHPVEHPPSSPRESKTHEGPTVSSTRRTSQVDAALDSKITSSSPRTTEASIGKIDGIHPRPVLSRWVRFWVCICSPPKYMIAAERSTWPPQVHALGVGLVLLRRRHPRRHKTKPTC